MVAAVKPGLEARETDQPLPRMLLALCSYRGLLQPETFFESVALPVEFQDVAPVSEAVQQCVRGSLRLGGIGMYTVMILWIPLPWPPLNT